MKKVILLAITLLLFLILTSCEKSSIGVIGGADGPTAVFVSSK